jgi:hypothetical protein
MIGAPSANESRAAGFFIVSLSRQQKRKDQQAYLESHKRRSASEHSSEKETEIVPTCYLS